MKNEKEIYKLYLKEIIDDEHYAAYLKMKQENTKKKVDNIKLKN